MRGWRRACLAAACAAACLVSAAALVLADGARSSKAVVLAPSAPGTTVYKGGGAVIDASNSDEGYVCVDYGGSAGKVKVMISGNGSEKVTFTLHEGGYNTFPLTHGNGKYTVEVYTQVRGNQYALAVSESFSVELRSQFAPFLYPNQYVDFSANTRAVKKAEELAAGAATDLDVVRKVFNYVIDNVSYDTPKAQQIAAGGLTGYTPVVDNTLATGKGICFDYAALLACMLRTQGIPARLETGYVSSGAYHAWVDVYITDEGWVNDMIHFDGKNWTLMDPTFASSGKGNPAIAKFIGDGSNYSVRYQY